MAPGSAWTDWRFDCCFSSTPCVCFHLLPLPSQVRAMSLDKCKGEEEDYELV